MAKISKTGLSELNFDDNEEVEAVLHYILSSFENNFVEAHEKLEKCRNIDKTQD